MSDIKRKLATIETILSINPIPDADNIEVATIRGWNVVIQKNQYNVGDVCVYCEIDSVLPQNPEFEFLRPRGFRIRTIKLRNQYSQGIIFPLSILPEGEYLIGDDVTDIIGIVKYEAPIPAELNGIMKGDFPSHSIKTDEDRIQI